MTPRDHIAIVFLSTRKGRNSRDYSNNYKDTAYSGFLWRTEIAAKLNCNDAYLVNWPFATLNYTRKNIQFSSVLVSARHVLLQLYRLELVGLLLLFCSMYSHWTTYYRTNHERYKLLRHKNNMLRMEPNAKLKSSRKKRYTVASYVYNTAWLSGSYLPAYYNKFTSKILAS